MGKSYVRNQVPTAIKQVTSTRKPGLRFTTRLLFAITAAIGVGFAAPLMPLVYAMLSLVFAALVAVPVTALWLAATPDTRLRESLRATARFFGWAIAVFVTILVVLYIRMEIMGQDF